MIQQQVGRKRLRCVSTIPTNGPHISIRRPRIGDCVECAKKNGLERAKRIALATIDHNRRHTRYSKRSQYGCKTCDVTLCKEGSCFNDYHSKYVI